MPWSALPPQLNPHLNPDAWKGMDTEWKRWVKGWFAFGPRATQKWAQFREIPYTLFSKKGSGDWRFEDGRMQIGIKENLARISYSPFYLSRVQPWCRWAFYINWPLFIHFHVFYRAKDVMAFPDTDSDKLSILKYFEFAIGFKRDADVVYWLTMFIGGKTE